MPSTPLPDSPMLEFASDDSLAGFRLQRLEVYNWGTFHNRVWELHPNGQNCLLTGDIGSGKSTLVDAITTLLVPANRIAYNKAAGAGFRERSLRSYVLGYYRTERSESGVGSAAKPVGLRDANSFSVILAEFHNSGYDQTITLACVLWMKNPGGQPTRFYLGAEHSLSIAEDFSDFENDMNKLRQRLRQGGARIFDGFPEYCAWFRRRFGIKNEQALDLFHQTVSMKSVGNLTDFVRNHMLEPLDVQERIEALIAHFDDLARAYAAVRRAKRQIELLEPIAQNSKKYEKLGNEVAELRQSREFLSTYFAAQKQELLNTRADKLEAQQKNQLEQLQSIQEKITSLRRDESELHRQISASGGDRINSLKNRIEELTGEQNRRKVKFDRYAGLLAQLERPLPKSIADFTARHQDIAKLKSINAGEEADLENRITDDNVTMRQLLEQEKSVCTEIDSLRARRSNIPSRQIAIRDKLCEELGLAADDLPYAGELLRVRDAESDWQGAAERLLHNFGLSLLVPDHHYAKIADWVDRTHLHGRLVYYRIRDVATAPGTELYPDSLVKKIEIKSDSPYYNWLERELGRRFNYACCLENTQFRRETHAITRSGQVKSGGERHEKDDRHRIDDRSRYILGWSNKEKITALEQELSKVQKQGSAIASRINQAEQTRRKLRDRLILLTKLEEYREYREIDWESITHEIAHFEQELQQLEASSDILRQLNEQLKQIEKHIIAANEKHTQYSEKLGAIKNKIEINETERQSIREFLEPHNVDELAAHHKRIEPIRNKAIGTKTLTIENCNGCEKETREWLQTRIDSRDRKLIALRDRLITHMGEFRREFEAETREFDAAIESIHEFLSLLKRLQDDDLPRFEKRFKELLNQNTIREIANFNAHLNQHRETIRERVERINQSLTEIDYNPGRYIILESAPTTDQEIRTFQIDLRSCTEGALTGSDDDQYSEVKFLQVRDIIERFRGREATTELDRRWTQKVTDVRNWFTFAASERWREDDSEHEHYSDSGGKSGGQKEKLAYTILAASLAYQFGLEWNQVRSRSFRFVVIDEAFGRGSDESAQYGLKLFSRLKLQLLIVTPLQKIHIIEPYVNSVGFVHNEEGRDSQLRNLSIEEYREEKSRQQ